MKLHVVYDKEGKIKAAVRLDPSKSMTGQIRPVAKPEQYSAEIELPAEHKHLSFGDACRQLLVDVSSKTPRLMAHPASK